MNAPGYWDTFYSPDTAPPVWDTGRPQPTFLCLADQGLLSGRLLDAGCGTGEHALLAAARGAEAMGADISPQAIARARQKAVDRRLPARFEVVDVLNFAQLGMTFDTVIDSGTFHVFDDQDRARYVTSLASVLPPGGRCYLLCISDREPGEGRPRRVRQDELRAAFSDGWDVMSIEAEIFELSRAGQTRTAQAWLAAIGRT